MEYMFLINVDETGEPAEPGSAQAQAQDTMGAWQDYNQMLVDGGHWIAGASLQPRDTATVVRRANGDVSVTDGPFAETKEQIGGFYVVAAGDLDQALELARAIPAPESAVEVRPVMWRPDA